MAASRTATLTACTSSCPLSLRHALRFAARRAPTFSRKRDRQLVPIEGVAKMGKELREQLRFHSPCRGRIRPPPPSSARTDERIAFLGHELMVVPMARCRSSWRRLSARPLPLYFRVLRKPRQSGRERPDLAFFCRDRRRRDALPRATSRASRSCRTCPGRRRRGNAPCPAP